jgi:hypothetical protein
MKFMMESTHDINGSTVTFDPFYLEHLEVYKAEVSDFIINGLSQNQFKGSFVLKNEHEDSFLIATKFFVTSLNGTADYKMNLNLGLFNFDANGDFYCEICEFFEIKK